MIQLRVRTEYSFGQTYAAIPRVIERLKELGVTAAGIVDRASTWGHVRFYNECKKVGIQPMLGVELIVNDKDDAETTMWFLAKNGDGLKEMYHATTGAFRDCIKTFRGEQPRLRRDDVIAMSDNIIKFAGDILDADFLKRCGAVLDLSPSSRVLNASKQRIATAQNLRFVHISDNAYAFESDRSIFDMVVDRGMKPTPQHLIELAPDPQAAILAAECAGLVLPSAPMIRANGDVEALCRQGIVDRGMEWSVEYEERLQHELKTIREKDFESYFLVVADMVLFAKKHMLVGPARGSSAGSIVCYLMRITEVDPIPHGLMFERFIDISRSDLPDIDIDFDDTKRHLVFEYMSEKYGAQNTAKIGTLTTFKPKSALIQVCKKLNVPPAATAAVKVAMIVRSSADSRANNCLQDTFETTEPGKSLVRMYPEVKIAEKLEGHATHTGVHAAGLLVSNVPLNDFATIDQHGIAQVEKNAAESLGMLKIDVLGLRTLGILSDSGVDVDWYGLKFDDPKVYAIFNRQLLSSIFQFEGVAMKDVSRAMKFETLKDIDAVTALARPGPFAGGVTQDYLERKAGKPYKSIHPLVEAHMADTFGLPVYQEQTLAIVKYIGKFDWKETSIIRKAMSKRMGKEFFDTMWEKFKIGATSQGVPEKEARTTWELINAMGSWAMNRCIAEGTLVRVTTNNSTVPMWCPIEVLYDKYVENRSTWIKQQKSMPRLMSLFPDGRGRPQTAKNIFKNGEKQCITLIFEDGTSTSCTKNHKFIIEGEWRECGSAEIGDRFTALQRKTEFHEIRGNSAIGKHWKEGFTDRSGANNPAYQNGRTKAKKAFRERMKGTACNDCCEVKKRMEVHHNDLNEGIDRPDDLAWLCSGCHKKRHHALGDRGKPFDAGHDRYLKTLIDIVDAGFKMTYDIEMQEHHNYVVDGGTVTHNSHTHSYAVISYWTAWLKAYYPLEFAAANLRNAKDDDNALRLLRELVLEGINFVPFDPMLAEENWAAKSGKLFAGYKTLHGFGDSKSKKYIDARKAGKLTKEMIETANAATSVFKDIWPVQSRYADWYANPDAHGIATKLYKISELDGTQNGSCVFLGKLLKKNARNYNEDVLVKKRGGKVGKAPLDFLDLSIGDDTSVITARVDRFKFMAIGKDILDNVPVGKVMMIRARLSDGIRFGFIERVKVLD